MQTAAKAQRSPVPSGRAKANATMASVIAAIRVCRAPNRAAALPHAGTAAAADRKNSSKSQPSCPGAPRRSATKNRNRVDVTATGAAFTSAISNRRRATASDRTVRRPVDVGAVPRDDHSGAISSRASAVAAANASAYHRNGAPVPVSTVGNTAAMQTPINAPVSRQAARRTWLPSVPAARATPWA